MTEQEIAELVMEMRRLIYVQNQAPPAYGITLKKAADAIEALQASYESACERADEAEARNVFLLTELERILKEAGK